MNDDEIMQMVARTFEAAVSTEKSVSSVELLEVLRLVREGRLNIDGLINGPAILTQTYKTAREDGSVVLASPMGAAGVRQAIRKIVGDTPDLEVVDASGSFGDYFDRLSSDIDLIVVCSEDTEIANLELARSAAFLVPLIVPGEFSTVVCSSMDDDTGVNRHLRQFSTALRCANYSVAFGDMSEEDLEACLPMAGQKAAVRLFDARNVPESGIEQATEMGFAVLVAGTSENVEACLP